MLISLSFLLVVFLIATQDIALDGWALTLLPPSVRTYASTCQSLGLQIGGFVSFSLFMALHSAGFCNRFLRSTPSDTGLLSLEAFMYWVGFLFILVSVLLLLLPIAEPLPRAKPISVSQTYMYISHLLCLKSVRQLSTMLLLARLGAITTEAIIGLKFIEIGLPTELLGLISAFEFPFQIGFALLIGRSTREGELALHMLLFLSLGYLLRLVDAF